MRTSSDHLLLILFCGLVLLSKSWADKSFPICPRANPSSVPCATLPVAKKFDHPQYTEAARKSQIEGSVTLSLRITKSGEPRDIKLIRSLDSGLDANAITALKKWRFAPGTYQSRAVPVKAKMTFHFAECKAYQANIRVPASGSAYFRSAESHKKLTRQCDPDLTEKATCAPLVVSLVRPVLPKDTESHFEAIIPISIDITDRGDPSNIRVTKSANPELDALAIASAEKLRFRPALQKGATVAAHTDAEVLFGYCQTPVIGDSLE